MHPGDTMARNSEHEYDPNATPVAEGNSDAVQRYDKLRTPNGGEAAAHAAASAHGGSQHSQQSDNATANADDDAGATSEGLMHGVNSFWAIVYPICVTMVLASIVVVNYRSKNIEASMQTYLVFGQAEQKSGAEQVGLSLMNALVIIGAIAVLTFGMALLYKYNCMKFLAGYIMFASTAILSFVGGQLVDSVVNDQFGWAVDWPSFLFVMINFGVVGVISIFYQKGSPKIVQNGYLVCVSVILAWQFSMWPEWTTFIFCFMFAVYDLCAVLTPCGPLKLLIGMIQDKQAPLPGLIYEADVRDGVGNAPPPVPATKSKVPARSSSSSTSASSSNGASRTTQQRSAPAPAPAQGPGPTRSPASASSSAPAPARAPAPPVAPVEGRPRNVAESDFTTFDCETMEQLIGLLEEFYRIFSPEDVWKAQQVAEKFFPTQQRLWLLIFHKYTVCSCSIDIACPVQARQDARERRQEEDDEDDKTIKLGLGDFIFYSVLVGRAAIFDFSTFAVTFLCIVMGLGGTLFLLAVLNKALPALPISIFLATFFYLWTRYVFVDFCSFLMAFPAAA